MDPIRLQPFTRARVESLGAAGRAWADGLPALLAELERRWSVRIGRSLAGGSAAYVARAQTADGSPRVVKVLVPDPELTEGAHVLAAARGRGYVRLYDHDPDRRALLLEALGPSLDLAELTVEQKLVALADTLRAAWTLDLDVASGTCPPPSGCWPGERGVPPTPRAALGPTNPLPPGVQRILVTGCSGSGKSTLARAVSARLGLPYHELDALHHGPQWVPRAEFAAEVAAFAGTEAWISEWQYRAVRPLLLDRAQLLVWLDLPRWRVFAQLVPRTLGRRLRRTVLWNGNVEPPLWTLFTDPDHILRWAWRTHPRTAERVEAVLACADGPTVVRLRNRREIRTWLARL